MKAQTSLRNAESYFREHLGVGDYYMEGRSVSGQWFGEGAKELKLSGVTTEKDFLNLCHNIHPQTEEQLTPRMNTKRNSSVAGTEASVKTMEIQENQENSHA